MREIITLQLGQRANYLATHFWNLQVYRLFFLSPTHFSRGTNMRARNHISPTMKKSPLWTMTFYFELGLERMGLIPSPLGP